MIRYASTFLLGGNRGRQAESDQMEVQDVREHCHHVHQTFRAASVREQEALDQDSPNGANVRLRTKIFGIAFGSVAAVFSAVVAWLMTEPKDPWNEVQKDRFRRKPADPSPLVGVIYPQKNSPE